MGFKSLVLILIFAILSVGCTAVNYSTQSNYSERDYTTFNRFGAKHNSKIFLLDNEIFATNYVKAKGDSLFFYFSSDTLAIPISSVEKVTIRKWAQGIASGLLAGTVVMLASGFAITELNGGGLGAGILGAGSGLLLGIATLILGIIYLSESKYIFNDKAYYEQIEYYKKYQNRKAELDSTNLGS